MSDNIIIGHPTSIIFAGVSVAKKSNHCKVHGNFIQDSVIGIENAACSYTTIENNTIKNFESGISVNTAEDNRNKEVIIQGNILDTNLDTLKFGIQIVHAGSNLKILGNTLIDYGSRGLFFNAKGSNSLVSGNQFIVKNQTDDMVAIYIRVVDNLKITGNHVMRDSDGTSSIGQQGCVVDEADNIFVSDNYFDGRSADNSTRATSNGLTVTNDSDSFYCMGNYISNYDNNGIFGGGNTGTPAYFYLNRFRNCTHHLAKRSADVSHQNGGI